MKKISLIIIGCLSITSSAQFLKEQSETRLPEIVKLPLNSMDVHVADIDNDSDLDIVIAVEFHKNIILLNDGKGHFSNGSHLLPDKAEEITPKPYPYYPYHDSEDVTITDVNKDGLLDIIFVTEDDKTNEFYIQKKMERLVIAHRIFQSLIFLMH